MSNFRVIHSIFCRVVLSSKKRLSVSGEDNFCFPDA